MATEGDTHQRQTSYTIISCNPRKTLILYHGSRLLKSVSTAKQHDADEDDEELKNVEGNIPRNIPLYPIISHYIPTTIPSGKLT